jgi:hypothetical protein
VNSIDRVNRELSRLDTELRAGGIDRASFRDQRRKLLLDFEERETTTQPAAIAPSSASGMEPTLVDPPGDDPVPFVLPEPAAAPQRIEESQPKKKRSLAGIALSAVGAVVVLGLAGWWFARPHPDVGGVTSVAPPAAGAPIVGADTPPSLAATLAASQWSDADVGEFLDRWKRLSPAAIQGSTDDSRIWLLRGETGRRLREARETESLQQTSESRARVEQLEKLQSAIGTP